MPIFTSAVHNDVLALIIQITVLLLTARLFGEFSQRLGQPSVVGEILAGIILGPSCLGSFADILHPQNPIQGYLLEVVSLIGVMFLLLLTGLEMDFTLIRRRAKTALGVSFGGLIVTFSSGFLLGQYLPDSLLANPSQRTVFSLFIATAMSISAIPVIAKILMDMNLLRRDIGQTIIASGMSDDTVGWILLSIVAGLATGQSVGLLPIIYSFGKVALFLIISFTILKKILKRSLDIVQDEMVSHERLLTLIVVSAFGWGAVSHALHLEPMLGAFVVGILFGQMRRLPQLVYKRIESLTLGIFAPIFFAVAGLKVNTSGFLTDPKLFAIALLVIIIATLGKFIGTYIGARLIAGRSHWTALTFGAALNARGAMEIIVATIGLSLGILSQDMFSIIVLMAITTSLLAPTLLKWTLSHVKIGTEESNRLQEEELSRRSQVAHIHRVLLPIRQRENGDQKVLMPVVRTHILQKLSNKNKLSITLLNVTQKTERSLQQQFIKHLEGLFPRQEVVYKAVEDKDAVQVILEESQKDYDLVILGSSDKKRNDETIFSDTIDSLVKLSPCMTAVVHAKNLRENWQPNKILIPVTGSFSSRSAAEFGFFLASSGSEEILIFNAVVQEMQNIKDELPGRSHDRQLEYAQLMVKELGEVGRLRGAKTSAHVELSKNPESAIIEKAQKEKVDLIILGTNVRPASDKLFLGARIEYILNNSPCPVIILNFLT